MSLNQSESFFAKVAELRETKRPFAIATVISVKGSASAKPGSKAIIDESGTNVWGWVGGGCAESFVARNAQEAMEERRTRIVQADLDDEVFGLGMPCGGIMDVFIDPQNPPESIILRTSPDLKSAALHLAEMMNFETRFEVSDSALKASSLERVLYSLAEAIAHARGAQLKSLRETKGVYPESGVQSPWAGAEKEILILGSSRITEELARFGSIAKWPVRVYGWNLNPSSYPESATLEEANAGFTNLVVRPGSVVVVASHHKGDHEFIRRALESHANYVGLVASKKRSGLVFEHLASTGLSQDQLRRIFAPAGLDLQCQGPQEIALSCWAEIIRVKAQGS